MESSSSKLASASGMESVKPKFLTLSEWQARHEAEKAAAKARKPQQAAIKMSQSSEKVSPPTKSPWALKRGSQEEQGFGNGKLG